MFLKVGSIIKVPARFRKSEDSLVAMRVRQVAKEVLGGVLREYGEELAKKVQAKSFKNGVLTIVAPAILSGELYMRSGQLKEDINKRLGGKYLRSIRFRVG